MSHEWRERVWDNDEVHGAARMVLLCIADHANAQGHAWPTRARIARRTGLDPKTVYVALLALEAGGWVAMEGRHFVLVESGPTPDDRVSHPTTESGPTPDSRVSHPVEQTCESGLSPDESGVTPDRTVRTTTNPVVESVGTGTSTGNGQTGQSGQNGPPVTGRPFPVLAKSRIEEYGPVAADVAHRWTQAWEEAVNIADECLPHVSLLAYLSWCREKKRDAVPEKFLRWFINDQQKSREDTVAQQVKDDPPKPWWDLD